MTEKELKKLSRAELLELLLIQTRETERLQVQLEMAQQKIRDRNLQIREAGDLAQAVMAVNGVMDAAHAAASQYLENIARMEAETKVQCEKMLEEARAKAERIRSGSRSGGNSRGEIPEPAQMEAADFDPEIGVDQLLEELYQLLDDE